MVPTPMMFSGSFPVANGVRQGGAPILFTLYMNDLLMDLKRLGVGCFWDGFLVGVFCCADNIVPLAPFPSSLRILIHCCEEFAAYCGLQFNPVKTQPTCFSHSVSSNCHAHIIVFRSQVLWHLSAVPLLLHISQFRESL